MVEWEYKLVNITFLIVSLTQKAGKLKHDNLIKETERLFNKLSKEGWELFSHNQTALCATLYIWRRKK